MGRAGTALAGGSGFAAGPIGQDQFLYVSAVTPPTASSTLRVVQGSTALEIPGDTGASKRNTVIGSGADVTNAAAEDSIVIGTSCIASQGGTPTTSVVIIGKGLSNTAATACILIGGPYPASNRSNTIMIGSAAALGANDFVGIGYGMVMSTSHSGVQIGTSSTTHGAGATAIGNGAGAGAGQVAIGQGVSTSAATTNAVVIGAGALTGGGGNGVVLIGPSFNGLSALANAVGVGCGVDFTTLGAGWVILGNNNLSGQGYTPNVLLGGADVHTSGTAVPAALLRWKDASGADVAAGDVTIVAPRGTGSAASGAIVFQTGIAGVSSSVKQVATTALRLTATQKVQVEQDRGLAFVNQTSAAGAGGGTLTNAPAAGNPTHWLKVLIGGATFAIPCWPG